MKPAVIPLRSAACAGDVVGQVLRTRLSEVRDLVAGLLARDGRNLHDFRIACKRLRYALERFAEFDPSLAMVADRIASLQDALGEAHDRDVLLAILPVAMTATERRLRAEREAFVDRAIALWDQMQQFLQALDSHPI